MLSQALVVLENGDHISLRIHSKGDLLETAPRSLSQSSINIRGNFHIEILTPNRTILLVFDDISGEIGKTIVRILARRNLLLSQNTHDQTER